jgi:hypothetical protein
VIAPSLPGYVFSFRPGRVRFGIEEIAKVFMKLMVEVLGYSLFDGSNAVLSPVIGPSKASTPRVEKERIFS